MVIIFYEAQDVGKLPKLGDIEFRISGRYLPDEQVLILESKFIDYRLPTTLTKRFGGKTVHHESLAEAARRCVKYADETFAELKQLFAPNNPPPENKPSGSPYR